MKKNIQNGFIVCPSCGNPNRTSSKYCSTCGIALGSEGVAKCPTCNGIGHVICPGCSGIGIRENRSCLMCGGSGNVRCYRCSGLARVGDFELEVHGVNAKEVETVAKALLKKGMESKSLIGKRNIEVHLTNSVIGILNTGEIENVQSISVCVTILAKSGNRDIAAALKNLTEAVASDSDITAAQRSELLEQLEELGKQATLPPEKRTKLSVIKLIISSVAGTLGAAASLAEVWSTWGTAIRAFFGF